MRKICKLETNNKKGRIKEEEDKIVDGKDEDNVRRGEWKERFREQE